MTDLTLLEQQAVDAAINADWTTAITINKKILHENNEDIDSCLRLGFAYLQSNDLKEAQKYYKKALRIQPKNIIGLNSHSEVRRLVDCVFRRDDTGRPRIVPVVRNAVP